MQKHVKVVNQNSGGAVYGLGMIGALIYYIQTANSIGDLLFGVVKSVFWPGFLVYELLKSLGM